MPKSSEHIRNHPLRSLGVLEILRVRLFEQSLLAKNSGERTKKQQHTQRSALPGPMGNNATPTKETARCVDWISNVPIRACRHKPAGRVVCRGMEASTSKRHARPGHQGYRDHLKSNRYRLKRKRPPIAYRPTRVAIMIRSPRMDIIFSNRPLTPRQRLS